MSDEVTGFTRIKGKKIYYRIKGEGPPMVFVHGWSLNLSYWDEQVEFFSKNYTTYSYDWEGMGKSGGGKNPFTMKELSQELGGLIKKFKIRQPIIVGHSEGGAIVMRYAADHPLRISNLVLADTALNTPRDALISALSTLFIGLFSVVDKFRGKNPLVELAPVFKTQFYSKDFIAAHPEYIEAWNEQFISNSPAAMVHGLRAWAWRIDIEKKLQKVKAPTLLLWGSEDAVIKLEQMQSIQQHMLQGSELKVLDGSGHMTPVEVPDQFNKAMTEFIR